MTNLDIQISAAVDPSACRDIRPKQLDQWETNHYKTIDNDVCGAIRLQVHNCFE